MKAIKMAAREYLLSFAATILNGLCTDPDSKECTDSLNRLEGEVDKMSFIKQFGDLQFSFTREPEEQASHVMGQEKGKRQIPIEVAESFTKMMVILLVDQWGKTLLNL